MLEIKTVRWEYIRIEKNLGVKFVPQSAFSTYIRMIELNIELYL